MKTWVGKFNSKDAGVAYEILCPNHDVVSFERQWYRNGKLKQKTPSIIYRHGITYCWDQVGRVEKVQVHKHGRVVFGIEIPEVRRVFLGVSKLCW